MARFPKTLGDILSAQAESGRATRTEALSVPEMAQVGPELIKPGAVGNEQLADAFTAELTQRIDEAAASIVSSERIADGAVTANTIADFAITVNKIKSNRHQIY